MLVLGAACEETDAGEEIELDCQCTRVSCIGAIPVLGKLTFPA